MNEINIKETKKGMHITGTVDVPFVEDTIKALMHTHAELVHEAVIQIDEQASELEYITNHLLELASSTLEHLKEVIERE